MEDLTPLFEELSLSREARNERISKCLSLYHLTRTGLHVFFLLRDTVTDTPLPGWFFIGKPKDGKYHQKVGIDMWKRSNKESVEYEYRDSERTARVTFLHGDGKQRPDQWYDPTVYDIRRQTGPIIMITEHSNASTKFSCTPPEDYYVKHPKRIRYA
jgi:hypothetical protein